MIIYSILLNNNTINNMIYNLELTKHIEISFADGNIRLEGFEDTKEKRDFLLMVRNTEGLGKEVVEEKMVELTQTLKSGTQEEKNTIILDILDHYITFILLRLRCTIYSTLFDENGKFFNNMFGVMISYTYLCVTNKDIYENFLNFRIG